MCKRSFGGLFTLGDSRVEGSWAVGREGRVRRVRATHRPQSSSFLGFIFRIL